MIQALTPYRDISRIFPLFQHEPYAVFLDSSLRNDLGRYSIIGLHPYLTIVDGTPLRVNGQAMSQTLPEYLRTYLAMHSETHDTGLPLVSGAIGYFSYDHGRKQAGVPSAHEPLSGMPDSIFCFYDDFIIEDHQKGVVFLVANGHLTDSVLAIEAMSQRIAQSTVLPTPNRTYPPIQPRANFTEAAYLDAIRSMIRYIVEGDIYVANLTQRLEIPSEKSPFEVFQTLRHINPAPFGAYLNYGAHQVVCASPERFLHMRGGQVVTRPIKGTRKKGATAAENEVYRTELQHSEKDKSELLMIVDLERNDLNRVCKPGSVQVPELFHVEEYATVFHLVSTVVGELREGLTAMDLMAATFPGGSITGAPKRRAMEIIDELEHGSRGLYTGAIGYFSLNGDCDFNIVIRTAVHQNGVYSLGVGGGITYESEPAFEYEETFQKAKAILEALQ